MALSEIAVARRRCLLLRFTLFATDSSALFSNSTTCCLGVLDQASKRPSQMSGGQQQRVAVARALLMNPKFIFADEPTGNLDSANAVLVMNLLREVNREHHTTICLVTHDAGFSAQADREIFLTDGRLAPIPPA